MSKRLYICKIVTDFTGTGFQSAISDVVDPQTGMQAFTHVSVIGQNADGTLKHSWCLTIAAGQNHALTKNNPDIDPLPEFPLDTRMAAMHLPTRNAMAAKMQARGIDTVFINIADGFRDVVNHVGRLHSAGFDADNFDVYE